MKLPTIIIIHFLCASYSFAQEWIDVTSEYIKNPDFEEYDSCVNFQTEHCNNWYAPTLGTSDYHNSCSNLSIVGIPFNTQGHQFAYSGMGYYGMANWELYYEYIQSKLIKSLLKNKSYKLSYRISRAEILGSVSCTRFGFSFTSDSLLSNNFTTPLNPQNYCINQDQILSDTVNWQLIEKEFIANGSENFITIGWFGDNIVNDMFITQNIEIDPVTLDTFILNATYYYIDSISLKMYNPHIQDFSINILTPNNDGKNDIIDLRKYELSELNFFVYNRWGQQVCHSNDVDLIWDGANKNGNMLSSGTYYYIFEGITYDGIPFNIHNSIFINP